MSSYHGGSLSAWFSGRFWLLLVASWLGVGVATAGPVLFQASGLLSAGTSATFALDFVNGSAAANELRVGNLTTDGALTEGVRTGSVTGNLATGLLLQDTSALSEALINLS